MSTLGDIWPLLCHNSVFAIQNKKIKIDVFVVVAWLSVGTSSVAPILQGLLLNYV